MLQSMAGSRLVPAEKVAESAKILSNKRKKKSGKGKSRDDQSEDSDESEGSSVSAETDDGSEPDFDVRTWANCDEWRTS